MRRGARQTRGELERAERDARVALRVRRRGSARASARAQAARAEPALGVARARGRRASPTSSAASGSSTSTRVRESSGAFTSNDGFSVVAPIEHRPCRASTCGRNASCCALLKRWISSTNSTVGLPPCARARPRASATISRSSFTPAQHRRERDEVRAPLASARSRASVVLPRARAGPRGSATGRRRRRACRAAGGPGRAGAPGRRTRRGSRGRMRSASGARAGARRRGGRAREQLRLPRHARAMLAHASRPGTAAGRRGRRTRRRGW